MASQNKFKCIYFSVLIYFYFVCVGVCMPKVCVKVTGQLVRIRNRLHPWFSNEKLVRVPDKGLYPLSHLDSSKWIDF